MVFLKWIAVVMWAKLIYYFSSVPGLKMGLGFWDFFVRKSAHVFEFAYLTALLYLALESSARLSRAKSAFGGMKLRTLVLLSAVPAFLYAAGDEFHQSYVMNRHGCAGDVAVDAVGIFIVCYLILRTEFFPRESGILRGGKLK
ncbi:MAG: VanZ family protein [Elusimicrobia bacterium]|nr:VanZ family protein [Elusimicrobiota bacterium]